ncbi:Uncharacterized protein Adt_23347 [Abeliophyllum distichum]|uniref:Uncharacterized protein n=1 Tax=Abeliophyllum distichum TaxID=126358 RepID=A0ABD1SDM0_9LAMI
MASNYLLANKFKNKEHDEEITKENQEEAYTLECGEGTSTGNQFTHGNDEEEDDWMTDTDEDIDLEAERMVRIISYNNLLKQLYQEGNPVVDLLGDTFGRSFDYYVLYKTLKRKKRVPCTKKYGPPLEIVPPPTGCEEFSEDFMQIKEVKEVKNMEILQVNVSSKDKLEKDKKKVEIASKEKVIFNKPSLNLTKHLRPLYVKALVNGIPMAKVFINNGVSINTIPYKMLINDAKYDDDMILTEVILTSFNGRTTSAKGVMPLDITVESATRTTVFFMINGPTSYNVLLLNCLAKLS